MIFFKLMAVIHPYSYVVCGIIQLRHALARLYAFWSLIIGGIRCRLRLIRIGGL